MTKKSQIYKCQICGNIVEVLHSGAGALVCCGQPMDLMGEKENEEGREKHLPVVEKLSRSNCEGGLKIKIGEITHPMDQNHYIEWVEVRTNSGKSGKKFFQPNDTPEAEFHTQDKIKEVRAYCNIHGLWKIKLNS